MNRALFTGLTGTLAYQSNLDVIANNIVNASTPGYKEGRALFKDIFYHTLHSGAASGTARGGMNPAQIGSGVAIGAVQVAMTQGALQQTNQPLDAAIDGEGMFVLRGPQGLMFTRAGAFTLDDTNTLVTMVSGMRVQGWLAAEGEIDTTQPVSDMTFPIGSLRNAKATGEMVISGNVDASAAIGESVQTGINVYDSLGMAHQVNVVFTKTATNTWDVTASCGSDTASGVLTFDTDGTLAAGSPLVLTLNLSNGATPLQTITIDLGDMVQMAQASTAVVESQDGYPAAALTSVEIGEGGEIWGRYSDGRTALWGQIALASFVNAAGLKRVGDNLYVESLSSGVPQVGAPQTSGRGNIVPRSLELANVDLTRAFIDMVTAQRGFQASARVISMANQMLEDALRVAGR